MEDGNCGNGRIEFILSLDLIDAFLWGSSKVAPLATNVPGVVCFLNSFRRGSVKISSE